MANFGDRTVDLESGGGRVLWISPGATARDSRARLPAWTGAFFKAETKKASA
jgi:hypothetical protein